MAELDLTKLVTHFAQSNRAEGKSPKTITWYTEMLTDFARFLESKGCRGVLSEFDIETVRDFVVYEQERGMSPYTVQGKVRALKAFAIESTSYTGSTLAFGFIIVSFQPVSHFHQPS